MAGGQFPTAGGYGQIPNNLYQPDIWSMRLLARYYEESVVPQITNMDYEGEIQNFGDRVRIRLEPEVTIARYYRGLNLIPQEITDEEQQFAIDYGGYWYVPVDDVDRRQTDVDWIASLSRNAARQLARYVDSVVLAALYSDASTATTLTNRTLTPENIPELIIEAGVALDESFVPEEERFVVVPYWFKGHLKLNDTFVSAEKMGDDKSIIRAGRVGTFDRFVVYASPYLPTVSTFTQMLFGCRTAVTFATQYVRTEQLRSQFTFGDLMRGLQVFGWNTNYSTHLGTVGIIKG